MCTGIARRPRGAMRRGLDSPRRAVTESATEGLWREGDHWALRYRGREARLRHAKGLGYLAVLLEHPGAEIHVLELVAAVQGCAGLRRRARRASRAEGGRRGRRGRGAWTRGPRRPIGRASTSCVRSSSRPATGRMTSARCGPRRSSTSSPASWPARSVSAAATGPPHPRPSARARTSGARCTRPCARSPRRFPSSARISSARSTRARRARIAPIPSRRSRFCPRRPRRRAAGDGGDHAHRRRGLRAFAASRRAARALRRHEELIAAAVAMCRGAPHEERGEEGSTFAVFARASDALACALEVQRRSSARTGRAGCGQVASRCTPERSSPELRLARVAVIRCAAIRALAHGGQVLVSAAVRELAGEDLPPGASLRDLGVHRLRDVERPERLFQLEHPDLPREFPPLRSVDARRHNLLPQLTSFVGRERELAELAALLGGARLVTLTGAGGSGKTRLAIEVAARTAAQTRDGAWLVDLAPVFDPQLVVKAVARVLGVRERPHSDLLDDVLERLRESELLLVLDNCEHLVEACARLAEDLLRGCPELRLLATSREPLGVPGERVFRTGSLPVPAGDDAPDAIAGAARGDPVRRSRGRCARRLRADARHGAGGGTGLPQAGRAAARDRAGGRAHGVAVAGRPGIAPGRLLRAADRRRADGTAAPANPRGDGRLELRPAERAPARAVRPAVGVRRRLDARRRRDGVRLCRPRGPPRRRRPGGAGRQVARRARRAGERTVALPPARDAPAVRA